MLAMFPEDTTMERLETGTFQSFQGWEPTGYSKVKVAGQSVPGTIYFESDDIAANGVTGDGTGGTRERGEVWVERVVGFAVAFINQFDDLTKDQAWAGDK
jgi:creatinine amidohydrolase/Fe(II)-dependent formamide hydrolase-like protein